MGFYAILIWKIKKEYFTGTGKGREREGTDKRENGVRREGKRQERGEVMEGTREGEKRKGREKQWRE